MRKYYPLLLLTIICLLSHHKMLANWQITSVNKITEKVTQYEKAEFDIQLTGAFTNPYDQQDIKVDALFTAPSGEIVQLPVYYVSGDGTASNWKARFAPRESGTYSYKVEVRKGGVLESTSPVANFDVTASAKNGFLHKNNNWSFKFDSGKAFRGIGENMAWEPRTWEPEENTYDYFLPKYAANGANFFRTWMSGWNLPLEWKTVRHTNHYSNTTEYFHPEAIQRMDELVELAESTGMYMMLTLEWHGHLNPGADEWWNLSSYNVINGGPATTPTEFFTLAASKEKFKNRLRYIVARWGYSTSIAAWEFFNEVDNAMNYSNIPQSAITNWHKEMSDYMAEIDPYDHLMTTSISHQEIAGLKEVPNIDFNQKHVYRQTDNIPSILNTYVSNTGKPYVIGEFGREWDWTVDFSTIEDEKIYDYKRGQWYGLFNPTPVLPLSWWWEWFDPQGTNAYYAAVREISQKMLLAGNGSFEKITSSSSGLETYAVKTGNKTFVYLLNNSATARNNNELSISLTGTQTYEVKSFDPENRTYTSLGEVTTANNTLKVPGISLDAWDMVILEVLPKGNTEGQQSPFTGEAVPVPGKIEAENFDMGSEGVAYHDLEATNTGGAYRAAEGVDISAAADNGFYVSDIVVGEWLMYSVNIQKAGTYLLELSVAAAEAGNTLRVELNGQDISGSIEVPNTGGAQTWATVSVNTPLLQAGEGLLKVYAGSTGFNLDFLNFTLVNQAPAISITSPVDGASFDGKSPVEIQAEATDEDGTVEIVKFYNGSTLLGEVTSAPFTFSWNAPGGAYSLMAVATDNDGLEISSEVVNIEVNDRAPFTDSGNPHAIPGIIEAEDFDEGSAGLVYHELTPGNKFGEYRSDSDVDIEVSTDEGGGYNVGDFQIGEWVEYTVNVEKEANYDIVFRVATMASSQHFHLELNGENISGKIDVPNTGGWQTWRDVELKNVTLPAGESVLRVVADAQYFNLNKMIFTESEEVLNVKHGLNFAGAQLKPNPAKHIFNLELHEEARSVKALNMEGQTVFYQENPVVKLLSFGHQLSAGVYVVQILYKNGATEALRGVIIK